MTHKEFTTEYAKRLKVKEATTERYINTMVEIMAERFDDYESVTVKNMGRFYCGTPRYRSSETKVFKFTPARFIKDVLGWG
ncbi:MAG: hypothetical protein AB8G11_16530 [Saprospiraceae bacterium]